MEAKNISQRAVKDMINSNTTLLHIGNFETGKRTNLKRAVNECVYASRLYYNTELQSDSEKIEYLSVCDTYRLFEVKLYGTHIAAFNEYTEYHINFDETSKYYTLVISGMRFLIVSDMGYCNIYQVFDGLDETSETDGEDKEYKLAVEYRNGQRYCYYGKTKNNEIVVTTENRNEVEQDLNDTLFTCDSVTGNASGSYTFNAWKAEEYLCHDLDLLGEALTEFGCDMSYLERGAEACDVTIRCYLLGRAISEVLDEVETEEEE